MIKYIGFLTLVLFGLASNCFAQFIGPNQVLPTSAQCAQRVTPTAEYRPFNTPYNKTVPTGSQLAPFYTNPLQFNGPPNKDFFNVDGNYTGTTDEIIQWSACKWGMDPDMLRAEVWEESGGNQTTNGDLQTVHSACVGGNNYDGWQVNPTGNYCWTSFSLIQIKCTNYNACPMAQQSTAFALDFRLAYWRACLNGEGPAYYKDFKPIGFPVYPNGTPDQLTWGCMGSWFSGNWYDQGALNYNNSLKTIMASKPWLPPLRITSPVNNSQVSGKVTVSIATNSPAPNNCFYACLDSDTGHVSCTPGQGPWIWDSTKLTPNGTHILTASAYTCGLTSGNDLPIGWPPASISVTVKN